MRRFQPGAGVGLGGAAGAGSARATREESVVSDPERPGARMQCDVRHATHVGGVVGGRRSALR